MTGPIQCTALEAPKQKPVRGSLTKISGRQHDNIDKSKIQRDSLWNKHDKDEATKYH